MDSLVEEAVPGLSFAVFKRSIAICIPFLEKHGSAILFTKVGTKSLFKTATEDHRCPGLLFPPAIQIAVAIAARAAKILANLTSRLSWSNLRPRAWATAIRPNARASKKGSPAIPKGVQRAYSTCTREHTLRLGAGSASRVLLRKVADRSGAAPPSLGGESARTPLNILRGLQKGLSMAIPVVRCRLEQQFPRRPERRDSAALYPRQQGGQHTPRFLFSEQS